jgi:regulator of CtrA degradation
LAASLAGAGEVWQVGNMQAALGEHRVHRRLIDTLYVDAMVLADEARSYFDEGGRLERESLTPMTRVSFSCESLKVTTRLMHVIAWLLIQRAVHAEELTLAQALEPARRLGEAPMTDDAVVAELPMQARAMIEASIDLHRRVARLDSAQALDEPEQSPARRMLDRLATAF